MFVKDIENQNIKDETGRIKNYCNINTSINAERFKLCLSTIISEEFCCTSFIGTYCEQCFGINNGPAGLLGRNFILNTLLGVRLLDPYRQYKFNRSIEDLENWSDEQSYTLEIPSNTIVDLLGNKYHNEIRLSFHCKTIRQCWH